MSSGGSTIPQAILSWLHAARGPSDATRFIEREFGVTLSDAAASGVTDKTLHEWATGSGASVPDEVPDHKRFNAFIEKSTAKGLFSGVEEGTPAYDARFAKLVETFARLPNASSGGGGIPRSAGGGGSAPEPAPAPAASSDANDEDAAEDAKARGNDAVNAQQYHRAVECYSEAISLAPTGRNAHIYYSNRAAAYLSLKDFALAEDDARQSTVISPSWAKGWARLGSALLGSEQVQDAVAAYEKSLELDPAATAAKQGLAEAREKLRASTQGARRADPSSVSAPGGGGGLGGLASMLGGAGGGGLAGLMSNPAMAGIASEIMSDPEIIASLSDPEVLPIIMQMQSNPMAILQHMGNPKVARIASKLMGKMGGAGATGGGMPRF